MTYNCKFDAPTELNLKMLPFIEFTKIDFTEKFDPNELEKIIQTLTCLSPSSIFIIVVVCIIFGTGSLRNFLYGKLQMNVCVYRVSVHI